METNLVTLAPAAGSGIGKAFADALLSDPEFLPLLVAAAKNGLKAERSFWCGKGGEGYLEREPDMRTQIQTVALILANLEGEPIKRIIHQHLGAALPDAMALLQDSPAALDAAKRLVEKAEWHKSGRNSKAKRTQPAEYPERDGKELQVAESRPAGSF